MSKYKKKDKKIDPAVLQMSEIAPLAKRTKVEEKQHQKLQRFTKELNKDAWVKAVKLMKGKWTPFPEHRRCYASSKVNKTWGSGVLQKLVLEFKKAVLSQNWKNAVKLALVIFKNFSAFNERIHLKVFLSLLLSHPQVDEKVLTKTCSFLWKMEDKDTMAELMRCFCSMPKQLPSEFLSTDLSRKVSVRSNRDFTEKKTRLRISYTAHIGKSIDNKMYIN